MFGAFGQPSRKRLFWTFLSTVQAQIYICCLFPFNDKPSPDLLVFYIHAGRGGGGTISLAVLPLMKLERRGKNKRVRRYKTQVLVPDFKVSWGQVKWPRARVQFFITSPKKKKNGRRAAILASSCLPRSGASNGILFVRVRSTWGVDLGSRAGQLPQITKLVERGHVTYYSNRQVFLSLLVAFPTR